MCCTRYWVHVHTCTNDNLRVPPSHTHPIQMHRPAGHHIWATVTTTLAGLPLNSTHLKTTQVHTPLFFLFCLSQHICTYANHTSCFQIWSIKQSMCIAVESQVLNALDYTQWLQEVYAHTHETGGIKSLSHSIVTK